MSLTRDLSALTPSQVDAEINRIDYDLAVLDTRIAQAEKVEAEAIKAGDDTKAAKFGALVEEYSDSYNEKNAERFPYAREYATRGRWTRAYLVVTNGTGHVHSSTRCTTCYATTSFCWLTDLSGMDETEIVDLAGERACTVCYPTAPVEVRNKPTQLFTPEEIEAKRVREERAAAKVVAQGNNVLDANGKLLYKTERAATNAISSTVGDLVWYGLTHPSAPKWLAEVKRDIAALEARGVTYDLAATVARVTKRKAAENKQFIRERQDLVSQGFVNVFTPKWDGVEGL